MAIITHVIGYKPAPLSRQNYPATEFYQSSERSPRGPNGTLVLRSNPWRIEKKVIRDASQYATDSVKTAPGLPRFGKGTYSTGAGARAYASAYNKAYARMRGKLYKGNAALGVTLGSYKQSREMIVARATEISDSARLIALRGRESSRLLRKRQSYSGAILETIFGWQPLLADIHASCMTVIQQADAVEWVRATGTDHYQDSYKSTDLTVQDNWGGFVRATCAAKVKIVSHNRWLLERAGLLNPATVAWDLVPWSFVVNMFVNVNSLINSITDFSGLSFSDMSTTYRGTLSGYRVATNGVQPNDWRYWKTSNVYDVHEGRRVTGSFPSPRLEFKIPDANWELAVIAGSLMVQRISALDRIFSFHPTMPLGHPRWLQVFRRRNRTRYTE